MPPGQFFKLKENELLLVNTLFVQSIPTTKKLYLYPPPHDHHQGTQNRENALESKDSPCDRNLWSVNLSSLDPDLPKLVLLRPYPTTLSSTTAGSNPFPTGEVKGTATVSEPDHPINDWEWIVQYALVFIWL
ncbi:Protein of unknown function [Pyronema omphalodes CBS 100304]|uniref:Uncharacterized protein n=1 Tax=Pyronema omphalodes (strain CBS 100304) TaxID=1076935 RepID=U4L171_PYROM|nr:Protein of unknown function [Pyronema omphalodes CBS 100304]